MFKVNTPSLGAKKMRCTFTYEPNVNTYTWTEPASAGNDVKLEMSPSKADKYRVRIVGMDEDGRVTQPVITEIEYSGKMSIEKAEGDKSNHK